MHNHNENDKGFRDNDRITTYPHGSNISFKKYFQFYSDVEKDIRLIPTHYSIIKFPNNSKELELEQTVINHSSDINFKGFINHKNVLLSYIFFS